MITDPISRISPTGAPDPIEVMQLAALRRVGSDPRGANARERKRRRPEPEADADSDGERDEPQGAGATSRRAPPQRPAGGGGIDISV